MRYTYGKRSNMTRVERAFARVYDRLRKQRQRGQVTGRIHKERIHVLDLLAEEMEDLNYPSFL